MYAHFYPKSLLQLGKETVIVSKMRALRHMEIGPHGKQKEDSKGRLLLVHMSSSHHITGINPLLSSACRGGLVTKSCPTPVTSWNIASQGFPRKAYWSGLPFPSPGDLPDPGIEPRSPALQVDSFLTEPPRKPLSMQSIVQ